MMNENDEKEAVQARVSEGYAGIQSVLQEIQEDAASQGSNGSTKGEEAASMSVAADGLEEALTSYLREPDQGFWIPPPAARETSTRPSYSTGGFS
jgi:hypothetical protein